MERKKRSKGRGWESCYVKKNVRDVWCRNESVQAEIGQILQTHTHTHTRARASKLVVEIINVLSPRYKCHLPTPIGDCNREVPTVIERFHLLLCLQPC